MMFGSSQSQNDQEEVQLAALGIRLTLAGLISCLQTCKECLEELQDQPPAKIKG